jgi:hypothetical protein
MNIFLSWVSALSMLLFHYCYTKEASMCICFNQSHSHPWPLVLGLLSALGIWSGRRFPRPTPEGSLTRGGQRVCRCALHRRTCQNPKPPSMPLCAPSTSIKHSRKSLETRNKNRFLLCPSVFIPWPPAVFTCGEKGALPLFESQGSCRAFFLFFQVRAKITKSRNAGLRAGREVDVRVQGLDRVRRLHGPGHRLALLHRQEDLPRRRHRHHRKRHKHDRRCSRQVSK